ncbi:MAG: hypothetical protein PHT99_08650, partial [Methanoregula sp.]|nr:hypothetical protein [Methanoregula sp.]
MILSFSVFREKIEGGEKCQTIRKYSPGQYRKFLNTWKKRETTGRYNLFWHNPRNGGTRIKDVVPSDRPFLISFSRSWGQMTLHVMKRGDLKQAMSFHRSSIAVLSDLAIADGFRGASE